MYTINDLYDLDHTLAADYLRGFTYPWEALKGIKNLILELGPTLGEEYEEVRPTVWVHKTAKVFPSAYLGAPCIIGPNTSGRTRKEGVMLPTAMEWSIVARQMTVVALRTSARMASCAS